MFSASSTTFSSTSVLKTWILNISAKVSIRDLAHSMKPLKIIYVRGNPFREASKLLTARYFVLLKTRQEPVRRMLDYSENCNREFTDVGPDVAIKTNHAHKSTSSLCACGEESRAGCSASIQADK
jgi:hypothetical protein